MNKHDLNLAFDHAISTAPTEQDLSDWNNELFDAVERIKNNELPEFYFDYNYRTRQISVISGPGYKYTIQQASAEKIAAVKEKMLKSFSTRKVNMAPAHKATRLDAQKLAMQYAKECAKLHKKEFLESIDALISCAEVYQFSELEDFDTDLLEIIPESLHHDFRAVLTMSVYYAVDKNKLPSVIIYNEEQKQTQEKMLLDRVNYEIFSAKKSAIVKQSIQVEQTYSQALEIINELNQVLSQQAEQVHVKPVKTGVKTMTKKEAAYYIKALMYLAKWHKARHYAKQLLDQDLTKKQRLVILQMLDYCNNKIMTSKSKKIEIVKSSTVSTVSSVINASSIALKPTDLVVKRIKKSSLYHALQTIDYAADVAMTRKMIF